MMIAKCDLATDAIPAARTCAKNCPGRAIPQKTTGDCSVPSRLICRLNFQIILPPSVWGLIGDSSGSTTAFARPSDDNGSRNRPSGSRRSSTRPPSSRQCRNPVPGSGVESRHRERGVARRTAFPPRVPRRTGFRPRITGTPSLREISNGSSPKSAALPFGSTTSTPRVFLRYPRERTSNEMPRALSNSPSAMTNGVLPDPPVVRFPTLTTGLCNFCLRQQRRDRTGDFAVHWRPRRFRSEDSPARPIGAPSYDCRSGHQLF